MIYFDKVSKIYIDNSLALDNINLSIEPKEFISIVGHSGAGKTTLLRMLLAEEEPSKGSVLYGSTNIHKLSRNEITNYRRQV